MNKLCRYNNYNPTTQTITGAEKSAHALFDSGSIPADYTDIHSIENIHNFGSLAGMDFQQRASAISIECSSVGFGTLTTAQKDIVGIYAATDDTTLVTHYATVYTAGDIVAALDMHSEKIGDFVVELNKVAEERINHPYTKVVIMRYLKDRSQIDLFMAAIRNFVSDYKFKFHLGTGYGDSTDGLLDYIENTGGYSGDGVGLDSYEFSDLYKQVYYDGGGAFDPANPTALEQEAAHDHVRDLLQVELTNILVHGITQ